MLSPQGRQWPTDCGCPRTMPHEHPVTHSSPVYYFRTGAKVVCYYTNWSQYRPPGGKFVPEDIDVALCTHIVYAFAKLEDGVLAPTEWNDETTPWSKGIIFDNPPELHSLKLDSSVMRNYISSVYGSGVLTRLAIEKPNKLIIQVHT